jgi:hypothetical protein
VVSTQSSYTFASKCRCCLPFGTLVSCSSLISCFWSFNCFSLWRCHLWYLLPLLP